VTKSIAPYWNVVGLGEEIVKRVLKNSGLTNKEAEIYIFLAKHSALKATEIAKLLRKDRAQVFRILQKLQTKGFVDVTLDFPTQYTVVPFESVLESIVKAKREEVVFIEKAKEDLLDYMKRKRRSEPTLEKFVVIKGNKRVYAKIKQLVHNTKHQLSAVATVSSLMRVDRFDIFDAVFNHPLRSQIQYRFLTELPKQNPKVVEAILKKAPKTDFNFKVKNPNLGLKLFPRMITRDNEEVLFFTSPEPAKTGKDEVCLWTNSKSLVQTFMAVFEDLWRNSTDLQAKISEMACRKKSAPITAELEQVEGNYQKTLHAAKKEIMIMTSAKNLISFWESEPPLKDWGKHGVSIKIMAPITRENLRAVENLSKFCEIRHVAAVQLSTTVVDGKYLYQFKMGPSDQEKQDTASTVRSPFYSDDSEYVGKVKFMLDDFWRNAQVPSTTTFESILESSPVGLSAFDDGSYTISRLDSPYRKSVISVDEKPRMVTEKEVLRKMNKAKRHIVKGPFDTVVFYGKQASAVIRPPNYLNLPKMIIQVFNWNEKSSFGSVNYIVFSLWLETPKGSAFVPVAHVQDHPLSVNGRKAFDLIYFGTPAAKNIQVMKIEEFQVQSYGNVLFAGWTKHIPLLPGKYALPPAAILFEGYGKIKPGVIRMVLPSGFRQKWEFNGLEAFVTFFHPSAKYSGPGTDGTLSREIISTAKTPLINGKR
jgi:sugar-specific transcriptional regulator TrmB